MTAAPSVDALVEALCGDLSSVRAPRGVELNAPLQLTWSCYQREDVACGVCDSCALRLRGFQIAGIPDPIPYAVRPDYQSA